MRCPAGAPLLLGREGGGGSSLLSPRRTTAALVLAGGRWLCVRCSRASAAGAVEDRVDSQQGVVLSGKCAPREPARACLLLGCSSRC